MSGQLHELRTAGVPAPTDCWYALVPSGSVGRELLALRALGRPVVLFRANDGGAVALEDRCAHRAYPLSAGALVDDTVRCGLCGFVYDTGGQCVQVPTQSRVPFGAAVTAYPTQEQDGLVWVWFGEPGRARLHRRPDLPWLAGEGWETVAGQTELGAGYLLLHENFADVTQVPFVAPEIAPAVLGAEPPPLDVVVTETTVTLHRSFPGRPAARMAGGPARGGPERAVHDRPGRLLPLSRRMGRPLGRHPGGGFSWPHRPVAVHAARHAGRVGTQPPAVGGQPGLRRGRPHRGGRCGRRLRGLLPAGPDSHGSRSGDSRSGRPGRGGERERRRRCPQGPRDRLPHAGRAGPRGPHAVTDAPGPDDPDPPPRRTPCPN